MNIYEIDEKMRQAEESLMLLVDEETGEITNEELFDQLKEKMDGLQIARDKKIEGAAFLRREALDNIEAISNQISRLQGLKKAQENRAANLLKYITWALNGEKFKNPYISIYFKETESVEVEDTEKLPEQFVKVKKEPMKTELKKALKAGEQIEGVTLNHNTSTVISYGRKNQ